ncbi:MAG: DNA primase [Chloroflexi bacterium]|nr:DNA primase [Chloroflexota bacterium]
MTLVDDIKQRIDIVDIMSLYGVKLEKSGRNLKAVCPFHSEKHGSFFVFPEQQRWHCFGACATGGDVISFVMKREGVDFAQAIRTLADRCGLKVTSTSSAEEEARDRLFKLNFLAADYFHHNLLSPDSGREARQYLETRGLTANSISAFQLGLSLGSWDSLKNRLMSLGVTEQELKTSGLLVERDATGSYDRFRNRLMFPIRDYQGRITGFGARALDDSAPKYLNSPQSLIFDKGSTLYGIDVAKAGIKSQDRAVIVEGYMDVIMAHQHGFGNVVASMGTALTERQMSVLKRLTCRIALALDPDVAGAEATLRGIQVVQNSLDTQPSMGSTASAGRREPELTVVLLSPGKDPDEVIREDPAHWAELVDSAPPAMDYVIKVIASRLDLGQLQGRASLVSQVLPLVAGIREPVKRTYYVHKLADLSQAGPQDLLQRIGEIRPIIANSKTGYARSSSVESRFRREKEREKEIQQFCIALLLQNADLRPFSQALTAEHFPDTELRVLAGLVLGAEDTLTLASSLDPALREVFDTLLVKKLPPSKPGQQKDVLHDCIDKLRELYLREEEARKAESLREFAAEESVALEKLEEGGNMVPEELRELFHEPRGKRRSKTPR